MFPNVLTYMEAFPAIGKIFHFSIFWIFFFRAGIFQIFHQDKIPWELIPLQKPAVKKKKIAHSKTC